MNTTSTLADVISGNKPIKLELGLNTQNIVMIGLVLFTMALAVGIVIKKI